ncbi:MAG: ATP-binding cassette domain-containing protein [Clostridiales Family XIII bacterium]|jgi:energy-coupling factor transport system ATP-binding protein|nr:ATP-binding cassette domain-containing protein [Clostridiales Family XIII bacterium]
MSIIEIRNLTFTYPGRERPALDGVSLTVDAGEFVVLCGRSGCGKSTLLRHLKTVLTPHGTRAGDVVFDGRPLASVAQREQAARIGFVLQSPDNQIVTDKVWHELAFGLESLGEPTPVIRRRVAEMASFFGIQEWYDKSVFELSGGQKQILALASVMAMQPDALILDEPTSQLDPIAAEDFITTLKKINDEIGTTIILSEHRLEGALPRADRALVMDGGRIVCAGTASDVGRGLARTGDPMLVAMPTPMRVYLAAEGARADDANTRVPQTVREGRLWLARKCGEDCRSASGRLEPSQQLRETTSAESSEPLEQLHGATNVEPPIAPLASLKDVWFRYGREGRDVVKDLTLTVGAGEFVCVVGGNGTGKTTMLGVITGENRYYRGKARVLGFDPRKAKGADLTNAGLAALPQDPQTLFTRNTVLDSLIDIAAARFETDAATGSARGASGRDGNAGGALSDGNASGERSGKMAAVEAEVRRASGLADIDDLMGFHPYDISGGEQQRVGLAMALLTKPKLLLLDEPTKGMDSFFKEKFAGILRGLIERGMGVLMVSHDVEFCAKYADRCALFFDGGVVSEGAPRAFFTGNSFYTTAANRMARGVFPDVVTAEEIAELLTRP